jgi:general secretion pathway protein H
MSVTGDRPDAGTTLLEALVVLAITGLIGGLVFPSVERTLDVLSLRQSTSVLVANLRSARAQALRTGQPTELGVARDGARYAWPGGGEQRLPADERVSLTGAERIVFYADGSSGGGQLSVTGSGRRIDIAVDSATGAIAIRK